MNLKNFQELELREAIQYAKLRGVKTHLTLNTLIKNSELNEALMLANDAYRFGIDAIIVQDLGLGNTLVKMFPDLDIHASTQMSIHNLDGVKLLEDLGYSRVVLARELNLKEIQYICKNSNIEIETFIHGALCVSYSGQCLFSSIALERSGNRGKCAQVCRLPFTLLERNKKYLLSPKDMCGLEYIPELIEAGVKSLKIEGRMKSPNYVACVTRIYRKYIDLALQKKEEYRVLEEDKRELALAFNRGGFSTGYFEEKPIKDFTFIDKSNNMGLYLGEVLDINKNKGLVNLKLAETIYIGDSISFEQEEGKYTISELMEKGRNIKQAVKGQAVAIGRMKGNIKVGDKIYKHAERKLTKEYEETYSGKEFVKQKVNAKITIKRGLPINLEVYTDSNINVNIISEVIPVDAINAPITKEKVLAGLNKTGNSYFEFETIDVEMEDGLFIPNIASINELRRQGFLQIENVLKEKMQRESSFTQRKCVHSNKNIEKASQKVALLLNSLNPEYDYSKLKDIDKLYIQAEFFLKGSVEDKLIKQLTQKYSTYIYLPNILKEKYKEEICNIIQKENIKGVVVSHISQIKMLEDILKSRKLEVIGNYTLNIFNEITIDELGKLGISSITISPELNKQEIIDIVEKNNDAENELIVYGRIPVMTLEHCIIQNQSSCSIDCNNGCKENKYYLQDRLNFKFPIRLGRFGISTIENSKILSITPNIAQVETVRIDITMETVEEINSIIETVKNGERLTGEDYTNGNLERII